jgi:hypothetical protein
MAKIPEPIHTTINAINQAHEAKNATSKPRPHMGVSQLGKADEAEIWLAFRWAFQPFFSGRILRLFRRGHREEETVVADLIAAGMDVRETGWSQRKLNFGAHVEGSCDGIIMSGVPEAPKKPHLLEIKTISKSRFATLNKEGLEKSNPEYWVQVQCYMNGTGIDRCLFIAVCKDNDEIYTERVKYDAAVARYYIERGQRIALADRIPDRAINNPSDWRGKYSDYYAVYFPESATGEHWDRLIPQRESTDPLLARIKINYRTDATSTPRDDGTWFSERWQKTIPVDAQYGHDPGHVLHPDIMAFAGWSLLDGPGEHIARYKLPSGATVLNGKPGEINGERVFSSEELLADPVACAGWGKRE